MRRTLALVYGAVSYLIFFLTFLYAIGFVGNFVVPKSIDSGEPASTFWTGFIVDVLLLGIFGIQHSVMARPGFKHWWTRYVPWAIERSTYVLLASLALILLFWQWRPLTGVIWDVSNPLGRGILWAGFFVGWGLVLFSTFLINHFDLFGLRQVYTYQRGQKYTELGFRTPFLYNFVRHPIMVGFIVAFWVTPRMTTGHLLFAIVTTAYILVAIQLEEHDMEQRYPDYIEYRKRVWALIPVSRTKRPAEEPAATPLKR